MTAVADVHEPRTTLGGVNLVSGFRPELWRDLVPSGLPATLDGFNDDLVGADGYVMPGTQHDAVLWLSGSSYDVVFDEARQAIKALAPLTSIADETSSWPYRRYRDLTGFEDGTKNPAKPDSIELDPQPPDSHVARTDQEAFGNIFRRNMPYGTVTEHGTMFVGFCAEQHPLRAMLDSMAGVPDGVRDALTRYARPVSGAYYFVPSTEAIRRFATIEATS